MDIRKFFIAQVDKGNLNWSQVPKGYKTYATSRAMYNRPGHCKLCGIRLKCELREFCPPGTDSFDGTCLKTLSVVIAEGKSVEDFINEAH